MGENRRRNDGFKNIAEELIKYDSDLACIKNSNVKIIYLESDKPKTSKGRYVYGTCEKVQDKNRLFIDADFLITIYTENTRNFSEKQIKILIKHELLHIGINHAAKDGKITRENGRNIELSKNGIVAILRKVPNNKGYQWLLTGFDNTDTEELTREAAGAIATVIANESYAQEFSSFRNLVGAVIASLK